MPISPTTASFRLVVALALCLTQGCTAQTDRIGRDDGTDVCRPQRVALDETGNYFAQDVIAGAVVGAAAGGLVGLLAGRDTRSALLGAVAGGAVGAAGAYWRARQQQYSDQATLYRTMSSDIRRDNQYIDRTQYAFNGLVACRQMEADRVRADVRSGRMTRPQGQAVMAVIRQRSIEDLRIASTISGRIQGRSADFEFANAQVNPSYRPTSAAATPSQRPARSTAQYNAPGGTSAPEVQAETSTNVAKRDRLQASIGVAQANQSKFEIS
jgi:hypothetical protein